MTNKFTQKAQNTLNRALHYAREMGHTYIGSEHLLLGLLCEKDSIASRILLNRGADAEKLRKSITPRGNNKSVLCSKISVDRHWGKAGLLGNAVNACCCHTFVDEQILRNLHNAHFVFVSYLPF